MKYNLTNKIILVTGASRGIGKTIATKLAENGASVVLLSRKESDLQKMASEFSNRDFKYIYKTTDVSSLNDLQDAVQYTLDTWGGIHGIVNNAGITEDNIIPRMSIESFEKVININLKGVFNGIKAVSKPMIKNKYGRIINISSVIGQIGNKGQANYSAAKSGIMGLTKTAAKEFGLKNITVNTIAPGYIKTDMTKNLNKNVKEQLLNSIPLNRLGNPEDIASLTCFLLSDEATYITGQTINVDGGMVMQ